MHRFTLLVLTSLVACGGGTLDLDDDGIAPDDEPSEEVTVSPWAGTYAGTLDVNMIVDFGQGPQILDLCDGELPVEVDDAGDLLTADGECPAQFGTYLVTVSGSVTDAGETLATISFEVEGRSPPIPETSMAGQPNDEGMLSSTGAFQIEFFGQPVDGEAVLTLAAQ